MSQSTALKAENAIFVSSQRTTRQLVLEYEEWEMANDEQKKLGHNVRDTRSEQINLKLHRESINTKKCFEQTF